MKHQSKKHIKSNYFWSKKGKANEAKILHLLDRLIL